MTFSQNIQRDLIFFPLFPCRPLFLFAFFLPFFFARAAQIKSRQNLKDQQGVLTTLKRESVLGYAHNSGGGSAFDGFEEWRFLSGVSRFKIQLPSDSSPCCWLGGKMANLGWSCMNGDLSGLGFGS